MEEKMKLQRNGMDEDSHEVIDGITTDIFLSFSLSFLLSHITYFRVHNIVRKKKGKQKGLIVRNLFLFLSIFLSFLLPLSTFVTLFFLLQFSLPFPQFSVSFLQFSLPFLQFSLPPSTQKIFLSISCYIKMCVCVRIFSLFLSSQTHIFQVHPFEENPNPKKKSKSLSLSIHIFLSILSSFHPNVSYNQVTGVNPSSGNYHLLQPSSSVFFLLLLTFSGIFSDFFLSIRKVKRNQSFLSLLLA